MREVILVHRVEYPAVHGLEAVAHVGQGAADDNAHRVFYIACFHLPDKLGADYRLLGKGYVLGSVIFVLAGHYISFFIRRFDAPACISVCCLPLEGKVSAQPTDEVSNQNQCRSDE